MNTVDLPALPGGLRPLGRLAARAARDIPSSCFSIGCECLDRGMWDFDQALEPLARLGAKWARVQTGWAKCEPAPGVYSFAWLDHIVDGLLAVGIQPWFNVGYGNKVYLPAAPHPTAVGWTPVHDEAARRGWVGFAEALARHYAGRVSWYEVWNEPDIKAFWTPYEPSAESYTELVKLTAPALRTGDPAAKVVGGALARALSHQGLQWVQECFDHGLGEVIDAFSYHLYAGTPEPRYESLQPSLRALVESYRPGLPLWQGESGAPSRAQAGQALAEFEWDEVKQAKWNTRRALLDLAHEATLSAFFHAADFQFYIVKDQIVPKEYYFGLLGGAECRPKPAYTAAQSLCAMLAGEVRPAREANLKLELTTAPDEARAHAFVTPAGPVLAWWQAHDTMQPLPPTEGELSAWLPRTLPLGEPVLVDPLTQAVLALPPLASDGAWRRRVPVTDYPLLLADRASVPLAE